MVRRLSLRVMFLARHLVGVGHTHYSKAIRSLQVTQRFLVDTTDRLVAVKSLQNPSDVLQFYIQNPDMDISSLEATLRSLAKTPGSREVRLSAVNDERFQRLIATISGRLEVCDGRQLAMISNALAFFPVHSIEMKELAQRIADVTCRRENAFTPRNLSTLAMSFAALDVRDLFVVDFLRIESKKLMQDFSPSDLYMLMDAFRRLGVFPRDLFDLIVEKMQDEVDRFTAHEMAETLKVLSAVGLAKGFLIRRLSNLAIESLHVLTPKTTLSVFNSLAKLRFLDERNGSEIMDALQPHIESFTSSEKATYLMSLGLYGAKNSDEIASQLVKGYFTARGEKTLKGHSEVAWAICYFNLQNCRSELETCLKFIYAQNRTSNLTILRLLSEVVVAVKQSDFSKPPMDPVVTTTPPIWTAGMADAVLKEQEKTDSSRLYAEVMVELDQMRGASKLVMQRNQAVGPYIVDFLEESSKIVLDIDTLSRSQPKGLKHRHLEQLGYKPAVLNYWQWRRCRTDADKSLLLQTILHEPLKKAGKI